MNFQNKKKSILKESKKGQQPEKNVMKEQNKKFKEQQQEQPAVKESKVSKISQLQQESDDSAEVETIVEQTKEQKKALKKEMKKLKKLQKLNEQEEENNSEIDEEVPKQKQNKQKQNQNGSKITQQTEPEQSNKQSKKQEQKNKGKAETKQIEQEKIEPRIVKKPKITIIEEDDSEEDINSKKASIVENKQKKSKGSESDEMEDESIEEDSDLEELRRVKRQMKDSEDEENEDSEEENFKDISSDEEQLNKKKNKQSSKEDKKKDQQINKNQQKKVLQSNEQTHSLKSKVRNLNEKIKLQHLAICIPDSIISIPQSSELRSYFISELARTAAIFCVDEIIILKDNSYIAKSQNFQQGPYIARNLQYLETPQYLRKQLFPIHPDLKNAGLMNPIECHHHLKSDQYCPYREGVVMNRPVKENEGSWVEIGLKKQAKIPYNLATNTRVTLRINEPTIEIEQKNYTAEVISQKEPKEKLGLFWGYQVRLAENLNDVLKGGLEIKYDVKFLINQGDHQQFSDESILETDLDFKNKNVLLVFSGYNNLESIIDSDEYSKLSGKDALLKFDANFTMQKGRYGVKQLRLEEEMAQALSIVRRLFN